MEGILKENLELQIIDVLMRSSKEPLCCTISGSIFLHRFRDKAINVRSHFQNKVKADETGSTCKISRKGKFHRYDIILYTTCHKFT